MSGLSSSKFNLLAKIFLMAAALMPKTASAASIDLRQLSEIGEPAAIALVNDWSKRSSILKQNGISDRVHQRYILDLIPEILADLTYSRKYKSRYFDDLQLTVVGRGSPDMSVSLHSLPLFRTLQNAYRAGRLNSSRVDGLVRKSALRDVMVQVERDKVDIRGASIAVAMVGLRQNGRRLVF